MHGRGGGTTAAWTPHGRGARTRAALQQTDSCHASTVPLRTPSGADGMYVHSLGEKPWRRHRATQCRRSVQRCMRAAKESLQALKKKSACCGGGNKFTRMLLELGNPMWRSPATRQDHDTKALRGQLQGGRCMHRKVLTCAVADVGTPMGSIDSCHCCRTMAALGRRQAHSL